MLFWQCQDKRFCFANFLKEYSIQDDEFNVKADSTNSTSCFSVANSLFLLALCSTRFRTHIHSFRPGLHNSRVLLQSPEHAREIIVVPTSQRDDFYTPYLLPLSCYWLFAAHDSNCICLLFVFLLLFLLRNTKPEQQRRVLHLHSRSTFSHRI